MIKKAIAAGILAGLALFAIYSQYNKGIEPESAAASKMSTGSEIGSSAPALSLKDLDGKDVSLENFKGKKVMLNFWATWCPPCKAEMPAMQKLHEQKAGQIEIVTVNLDPQNDVDGFVEEYGLTFPVLLDRNGEAQHKYSVISIPTTFIINEKGTIIKKHIGSMTLEQMEELIK